MGRRMIHAIDVHAAGEPGRVILGADLLVKGATMVEKLQYGRRHLDWLRRLILREPRGYPGLCAPLITAPVNQDSDFGLLVLEQGGWRTMSGSNLMCAVTALVETAKVPVTEPETRLRVDTAVGTVEVIARVRDGRVREVQLDNVPAFVHALDHPLDVPEYGHLEADVVFGGQFFVQVPAAQLGLDLQPANVSAIIRAASAVRTAAAEQIAVTHPDFPDMRTISLPMITGTSDTPGCHARNAVVLPNGYVTLQDSGTWTGTLDRSPCGTGTCGRMAALVARGELGVGDDFVHESMLGMQFRGHVRGLTTVGGREGILPSVSGRAWITGMHQFVLEDDDPFPEGYRVGDIWNVLAEDLSEMEDQLDDLSLHDADPHDAHDPPDPHDH